MDDKKQYNNQQQNGGQEKQSTPIGENLSSGAEKVERIAENNANRRHAEAERVVKRLHEIRREKAEAERRVQLALEKQQREEERKRRHQENRQKRKNDNGKGGLIAAVCVLGAATLTLGAVVTAGAVERKQTYQGLVNSYRGSLYELTAHMEKVDEHLDTIRLSNDTGLQEQLLTDIILQASLAEGILEKMPVQAEENGNATAFLNNATMQATKMLKKIRRGERLDSEDIASLERLYVVNHQTREMLDELVDELDDDDFMCCIKDKDGAFKEGVKRIEGATLSENENSSYTNPPEVRTGVRPKDSEPQSSISSAEAEELCRKYFSDYNLSMIEFSGETGSKLLPAYNFSMKDGEGVELYAQISTVDGALIGFDYYAYCPTENYNLDDAKRIAEAFLEKLGIQDMQAVKVGKMGTTASITFAYAMDDSVYYPDAIEVKVCGERGVVNGYNASGYLTKHKNRTAMTPKLTMAQAREKLHEKLEVESSRLATYALLDEERTAYEFVCKYEDKTYFVYIDGMTGEELAIVNSIDYNR